MNGSELRRQGMRVLRAASSERLSHLRSLPIRPDTVFYESFAGNGVLCNPEAIFQYLVDHPDFEHLTHIWAIGDPEAVHRFDDEFRDHPRVSRVPRRGRAYWKALSTSETLINNATFPPAFGKRPGQVYVNTWHGTPLKLMGFDMPGGAAETANTLRNFLMADFLVAANPAMSEMYEDAYRLRNVSSARIIEEGYPRIDRQRLSDDETAAVRTELRRAGLPVSDRPIVLFAPTWRGESFSEPEVDVARLAVQLDGLQSSLGDDYAVLLRPHQAIHSMVAASPLLAGSLVPRSIPTNVLLGVSSGLVTDYSSILFDFLATGRPMAFLTSDAEEYRQSRGVYLPLDELPGPVSADSATVGRELRALLEAGAIHPAYAGWASRFAPFDDGRATERVVDVIFRGGGATRRVRTVKSDGRRRLLLHLGGMRSNGITTAALNLLDAIDHDAYDVTVVLSHNERLETEANRARIHPRVRQVLRIGGMSGSKFRQLQRRLLDRQDAVLDEPAWYHTLWEDEWVRVFGSAEFDWVADFSGYDSFWANLLLRSPEAPRAIWLHNEMVADRARTVRGKQPFTRKLGRVFALYSAYDQLVSVSPALAEVNRAALSDYAPPERFVSVRNFPNPARVRRSAEAPLASLLSSGEERPEWMRRLDERRPEECWFATVGRLSPAKNQAGLIRAFERVHEHRPETGLVIVGGGPLEQELRDEIRAAGLEHSAFLTGEQENPFPILAASDCFVMASHYEGQPMVLFEAALCRLPIVTSAFATVGDALPRGSMRVVAQGEEELAEGMTAFLRGEVPPPDFDPEAYMAEVMREFERLAGSTMRP